MNTKRFLDILLGSVGLIISSPFLLVTAAMVYIFIGSPVIFRQQRPGLHGKAFHLMKFRTMKEAYDEEGKPLPDELRLTRFGRMLRSTSLDELPELFNIIKGDMSLVGPRPLLMQYLERYSPEQRRRHEIKPGITGWAQINGRNAITWEDKFKLDVWYVDHWSIGLDVKIIFKTIWKIVKREGIAQPGQATMEEFLGNGKNTTG